MFYQQVVDGFLRGRGPEAFFADVNHQRFSASELQYLRRDQAVVDYHIGFVQRASGFERQQFGVTGATADKGNVA